MLTTSSRTRCKRISKSWIMRSRTTPMSRLRLGKGLSRCTSMKRGRSSRFSSAPITGLKRSMCPTCRIKSRSRASRTSSAASVGLEAIGFSMRTCLPAVSKARPNSRWVVVGVATVAASILETKSSRSAATGAPVRSEISAARSGSASRIALNSTFGRSESTRAWFCPIPPTPATPIRIFPSVIMIECSKALPGKEHGQWL